ncbi:MAG: cytochrome b N-terminal domain-containing protein, partial [Hyphomicrobiales bacterium]|nr:cytochrome b N-terminal domain-containing protein [Hyphomicrobiales bacterium]
WLWGGFAVGNPTLNRFFALHYLLPFVIVGVVLLHVWSLHVSGNGNPTGLDVKKVDKETVPFHPYYTVKDGFVIVMFLLLFAYFVFFHPNLLGHPDNYIEANPLVTPAHIVPEWYLLPFYAILRAVPSKLGGVIVMFGALGVLLLLPWLDTSKIRSAKFRPLYRQFFFIFLLVCLGLGWLGAQPAEGGYVIAARLLTVYYFAHFFVILPALGYIEKPKPMPASIEESLESKTKTEKL